MAFLMPGLTKKQETEIKRAICCPRGECILKARHGMCARDAVADEVIEALKAKGYRVAPAK